MNDRQDSEGALRRRRELTRAARWLLRDADTTDTPAPRAASDVIDTLDDPALTDALRQCADTHRLTDDDISKMRASRRRMLATGGSAIAIAFLGLGALPRLRVSPTGNEAAHTILRYSTGRGERRMVMLSDGTRIALNGQTSLSVEMAANERHVTMQRGQAWFDVTHDPERPFTVHAGNASTRVLGTSFDIDIGMSDVRLAVYRGRVRFGPATRGNSAHDDPPGSVLVSQGWRSRLTGDVAGSPRRFDANHPDWRDGWIDTDNMSLGDLVLALNRQSGPLIARPPAAIATRRISGRFRTDDASALLHALADAYGFRITRRGGELVLAP